MVSGILASEGLEASKHNNSWKLLVLPIVFMNLVAKTMETIGKTNSFHDLWNYGLRALKGQNIVPDIMEVMEITGFTNSFHEFGSKNYGSYW